MPNAKDHHDKGGENMARSAKADQDKAELQADLKSQGKSDNQAKSITAGGGSKEDRGVGKTHRVKILAGVHQEYGNTYEAGDVFESRCDLPKVMGTEKFAYADDQGRTFQSQPSKAKHDE
jgi:hypothetical protein